VVKFKNRKNKDIVSPIEKAHSPIGGILTSFPGAIAKFPLFYG